MRTRLRRAGILNARTGMDVIYSRMLYILGWIGNRPVIQDTSKFTDATEKASSDKLNAPSRAVGNSTTSNTSVNFFYEH